MKKIIAFLLSLILITGSFSVAFAEGDNSSYGAYKHVFIIGIDGAGRFIEEAETPNFDRIFKDGAVDYTARAEIITTSAQNWGAILTGVSYSKHKMTNTITDTTARTSDTEFPTIFTYVRRAMPEAELASIVNWDNINDGIIENDIDVKKSDTGSDEGVTDLICDYFDEGNKPALFFVQFDSVDGVGHESGSKSEEFIKQIETVDGYLGRVYDSIEENGLLDDSLFIVVADHGHTVSGGHGGLTMRETNVTLAISGKTVVKGSTLNKSARNRDVAAISLYALGIERPEYMTSIIPSGLFESVEGESRSFSKDPTDYILSSLSWVITLFTSFI